MARKYTYVEVKGNDENYNFVDDIAELVADIRPEDKEDLEATGNDVDFAIIASCRLSDVVRIYRDDKGACLFIVGLGRVDFSSPGRAIWMIGTNELNKGYIKSILFAEARNLVGKWVEQAGLIHNVIHKKNIKSINYMQKVLGAKILPETIICTDNTEWVKFYIVG